MDNNKKLFPGFVVMTIGILLLLGQFGIITWSIFGAMFELWPILLIALGINLLFNNHPIIKMVTFLGVISAILIFGFFTTPQAPCALSYNITTDTSNSIEKTIPLDEHLESAVLNIKIPAGNIEFDSLDDALIEAQYPNENTEVTTSTADDKKQMVVNYSSKNINFIPSEGEYKYKLSKEIPWDININSGAIDADLDFGSITLNRLVLASGAGDISLNIGNITDNAQASLSVAATDIKITIPKDTGCKLSVNGGIHDIVTEGGSFSIKDNTYTNEYYENASKKIDISLNMVAGDIEIEQK